MTRIAYGALWLFVFSMPWETMLIIPGVGLASRLGVWSRRASP